MLYIFMGGILCLLFVYLRRVKPQMPLMRHENVPYGSLTGRSIGRFFAENKIPYVLDVRMDDEIRTWGLKHTGSTVIVYIPLKQDREKAFLHDVLADSRMQTVLEEKREFLVMCAAGARSAHACILLKELGFNPINLYDGLAQVPQEFVRTAR